MRSRFAALSALITVIATFGTVSGVATPAIAQAPTASAVLDRPARGGDAAVASDAASAAAGPVVSIAGSGWGHGIGLSQYGAQARALEGATASDIITTYYTGASVGSFGVDGIPMPDTIFTNVGSDLTSTTLTALDGPGTPHIGITVTRFTGGAPQIATLMTGDTIVITDTTPAAGSTGGCTATVTISGTATEWGSGSCDFDAALTADATVPTNLIRATNCRTPDCTFGYGTALHIVDNGSPQRTIADPWAGFDLVVESTVDEYTRGIAEVPFSWQAAALEAQAIAARSYGATFVVSKDHTAEGCFCDVKNNSSFQVYAGWIGDRLMADRWDAAATATAGKVVTDPSAPHSGIVRAFYTSSNGGASENNEDLWGFTPISYLRSIPDPHSITSANPLASWTKDVPQDVFASTLGFDVVTDVTIVNRFVSGTPKVIEVSGVVGEAITTKCFGMYEPCVAAQDVTVGSGAGELFDSLFGLYSAHIDDITLPAAPTDVNRIWGTDRYATAVEISKAGFPAGAQTVYIATGTNFPDALAAAPLTKQRPGPVLLVQHDDVPSSTADEIARLDPTEIVVLGGTAAVSSAVASDLAAYAPVKRLAGADRYSTAAEITEEGFPSTSDLVYIAVGTTFPDALIAAPVAAADGAPLLLVQPNAIPSPTRAQLDRLQPSTVVVVGGGTSISQAVISELATLVSGSVVSIAGSDRYATSALLAQYSHPDGTPKAFVATGADFPDAFAVGALAGREDAPVLLVKPDALPSSVAAELVRLGPETVVILGGDQAIDPSVESAITALLN